MKPKSALRLFLTSIGASLFALSSAKAQTFTWDGGGGDDLFGTGANWVGDSAPSTGSGVVLNFTGGTRTTPVNNYTTGDNFGDWFLLAGATSPFTITGNGFGLYGKIENSSSQLFTVNTAGIYARDGSIELNPVGGNLTIGSATAIELDNNATLNVYDGNNGRTLTINGTLSNGNGTGGNGQIILNQTATVVLTGTNDYGGTTLNAGTTLRIGDGGTTGTLGVGNVTNNGSLFFNRSNDFTVTNLITGTGSVTKQGAGVLTINNTSNSYSGQLTVANGTLAIAAINNVSTNGNLGNSANAVILGSSGGNTGTLRYTGGTATSTKPFTMATGGTGAFEVTTGGTSLTLSGLINGSGALSKTGSGTLVLGNASNSYSGGTVIGGGTLTATADANLGAAGSGVTVVANSTIVLGSVTYANRTLAINNGALLTFGNFNATWTGNVTGNGSIATSTGFGSQQVLSGTNNTFEGQIRIAGTGTGGQAYRFALASLADSATANGKIIFSTNSVTHANGSVFEYNGSGNLTLANRQIEIASTGATPTNGHQVRSSGTGTLTVNTDLSVTSTTAQTLRLGGTNTGNNIFGGVISNGSSSAVTLQKADAGTWTLTRNNTHSGGTSVTAGTLNINHAGALGTGTFTWGAATINNTSGSAITNANNNAIAWNGDGTFTGTNALDLGTGNVTLGGNRTITISGTLTMGGSISGAFGVTKGGGGTMVFSNTNSGYTGATNINQGTLSIAKIDDYSANSSIGAPTSGSLRFGSTNLNGTLTYTGGGDGSNRTIQVGNGNAGTDTGGGTINSNGTGALTFTATTFNTAHATATATRTLTLGGTYTGSANEVQGAIQNNNTAGGGIVSITKSGASTWKLSGANTYTGTTTITGGTLLINGNSSTATGNVNVNAGTLGGTGAIGGAVSVAGGATLAPGASIESLAAPSLTMAATSTFAYEVANNTSTGADLLAVGGTISLTNVTLSLDATSLAALGGGGWITGDKLTLISYLDAGSGITSGFTGYLDDTSYFFGTNEWLFDYNDTVAGDNFVTDATATSQNYFVTMTLVPEPTTALLGSLGLLVIFRRRRA